MDSEFLIIDDDEIDREQIKRLLTNCKGSEPIKIFQSDCFNHGKQVFDDHKIVCVLLDYNLPDLSGNQLLEEIKNFTQSGCAVILLTGFGNEELAVKALKSGAQYYLTKSSLTADKLREVVHNAISEINNAKQAEYKHQETCYLATHDTLTGIANRHTLRESLKTQVTFAIRHHHKLAILYLDVDNFKSINDLYGHDAGDILLTEIAEILKANVRASDIIARLGGDEFAIILPKIRDYADAGRVACKILKKIQSLKIHNTSIKSSIGIYCLQSEDQHKNVEEMLKCADIALSFVKQSGGCDYKYFSNHLQIKHEERIGIENAIFDSIEHDDFYMKYLPIIQTSANNIFCLEALLRSHNQVLENKSPLSYIKISEDINIMNKLGNLIIDKTLADYQQHHLANKDIVISINVSPRQLYNQEFVNYLQQALENNHISANNLILELTETAYMKHRKNIIPILNKLKDIGINLALDDFGSGYSSLSQLVDLPLSFLKVDREFISDIAINRNKQLILKSANDIANNLNLKLVIEGVENEQQYQYISSIYDHILMQGYYFYKPSLIEDIGTLS